MKEQHDPLKEQHAFGSNGRLGSQGQSQGQHVFGNYDLVRRIDEGGMGEVYLARQRTAFDREVAVKIIRTDLMHDVTVRQRFLREAEVNAHLKHEHILPLVEFGEDQGRLFLVTPYIDGGTLAQHVQSGPMALTEVHQLFSALVRAVSYIHKRGVVHRDLKPSNVLLDQDEGGEQVYVRLIDFGIASIQGTAVASPELTQSGQEVGTIEYMAPERLDGIAAPSNDIYSLGVILYQMLTGHLPDEGEPVSLPSPMEYVIKHCTAPIPSGRFATADELLRVFEQAYQAVITPTSTPTPIVKSDQHDGTPRRVPTARPTVNITQGHAGGDAPLHSNSTFKSEDYNAPTTFIDPTKFSERQRQTGAVASITGVVPGKPVYMRRRRKKGSIFAFISFASVAILVVMGLLGYYTFIGAITATVTVSPQVHALTKLFAITAKPTLHTTDVGTVSVPAYVLNSSKTGSQQGNTTGKQCILGIFDCKQVVSFADVDPLAVQLRQTLRTEVQQDLMQQAQASAVTTIGAVNYVDGAPIPTPDIGGVSDTVTVTMKEQGAVEYIKGTEVQSLARILLTQQARQQFGTGYVLLDSSTQIGQPVIQNVDTNGVVTMQIAVGGVVQYQISSTQIQDIQTHIKGTKQKDAQMFLMQQPGIVASSVAVHVTYGDTLPGDTHQIKVIPITPSNIPDVQLPPTKVSATPTQ